MSDKWLPIETAPKDGTKILLLRDEFASTGWWENGPVIGYFITGSGTYPPWSMPTHWMPFPTLPKEP